MWMFRAKGKGTTQRKFSKLSLCSVAKKLSTMSKPIETKSGVNQGADGQEIGHDSFITWTRVLIRTTPGIRGMEDGVSGGYD